MPDITVICFSPMIMEETKSLKSDWMSRINGPKPHANHNNLEVDLANLDLDQSASRTRAMHFRPQ